MNAKIVAQLETTHRAVEELTGAGIEIRRIYIATDQGQAVIVCVERRTADRGMEWLHGCRLVWLHEDAAHEDGDITAEDQLPHASSEARFGSSTPDDQTCRVCDCTDTNACTHEDGSPCFWIQPGLCSACAEKCGVDIDAHRSYGAEADVGHAIAGVARGELPR